MKEVGGVYIKCRHCFFKSIQICCSDSCSFTDTHCLPIVYPGLTACLDIGVFFCNLTRIPEETLAHFGTNSLIFTRDQRAGLRRCTLLLNLSICLANIKHLDAVDFPSTPPPGLHRGKRIKFNPFILPDAVWSRLDRDPAAARISWVAFSAARRIASCYQLLALTFGLENRHFILVPQNPSF